MPDSQSNRIASAETVAFAGRARAPRLRRRNRAQSIRLQPDRRRMGATCDASDRRLVLSGLGGNGAQAVAPAALRALHGPAGVLALPKPQMVTVRCDAVGRILPH